jgi:hypothetical protein
MKMHLDVGGSLRSPEVSGDMGPFRLTDRELDVACPRGSRTTGSALPGCR